MFQPNESNGLHSRYDQLRDCLSTLAALSDAQTICREFITKHPEDTTSDLLQYLSRITEIQASKLQAAKTVTPQSKIPGCT